MTITVGLIRHSSGSVHPVVVSEYSAVSLTALLTSLISVLKAQPSGPLCSTSDSGDQGFGVKRALEIT